MQKHIKNTQENQAVSPAQLKNSETTHSHIDMRPQAIAQRKLMEMTDMRPQAIQMRAFQALADKKNSPIAQLMPDEEELLQGKFATTQLMPDEEEILQGKFATAQLMPDEEELLQGKFAPIQKKENNNTGLPDNLKSGIENLSGYSMNDVNVHYNSPKPAQLQAHAYAQGTDIHLGAGQEKHLPHEAWHVVQQKQGRVKPTMQMKGKVNVNDDAGLEKEADVMGAKALQMNAIKGNDKTIKG